MPVRKSVQIIMVHAECANFTGLCRKVYRWRMVCWYRVVVNRWRTVWWYRRVLDDIVTSFSVTYKLS